MKFPFRPLGGVTCLVGFCCCGLATAQTVIQSNYVSNPATADVSGFTLGGGGAITLTYELAAGGTSVPGLGSSFRMTYTMSAITSYIPGNTYSWDATPTVRVNSGGNYLNFRLDPGDLYTNLPAGNQGTKTYPSTMSSSTYLRTEPTISLLGEFTMVSSLAPAAPPAWTLASDSFVIGDSSGERVLPNPPAGMRWTDSAYDIHYKTPSQIRPHGVARTFDFVAVGNAPVTSFTYSAYFRGVISYTTTVPEPSAALLLGGAGLLVVSRRKREASRAAG